MEQEDLLIGMYAFLGLYLFFNVQQGVPTAWIHQEAYFASRQNLYLDWNGFFGTRLVVVVVVAACIAAMRF